MTGDASDLDPLDYADVLGQVGPARLRQLAAEAWRRSPRGWAEGYLMECLVKAEGDVDALVALYVKDLVPSGVTHLRIAEELGAADMRRVDGAPAGLGRVANVPSASRRHARTPGERRDFRNTP
ncbi:hypothetical protein ACFY4I_30490 [Streptomyces scabiei]|uniref:hypothetical protein n=1 Tax=Streptomyces scabiei TaxID=1930 RepID=UPI0036D139B0